MARGVRTPPRGPRMARQHGSAKSPLEPAKGGAKRSPRTRRSTRGLSLSGDHSAAVGAPPRRTKRTKPIVRRSVLLALLACGLFAITATVKGDVSALRGPQRAVLDAVEPIEYGIVAAWRPVEGAWDWTTSLVNATNENRHLHHQVQDLQSQVANTQATLERNSELRTELKLQQRAHYPADYTWMAAEVIARHPEDLDQTVVVDRGSDNGVDIDDPVLLDGSYAGRVEAVSHRAARVALMTAPQTAISATVLGASGAEGMLRPTSNDGSPVMDLQYVTQSAHVKTGQKVVTAGWTSGSLQSIYPYGIPLGVVSSVGNDPSDVYKTVQVTPYVDFGKIDVVQVLKPNSASQNAFEAPSSDGSATADSASSVPSTALRTTRAASSRTGKKTARHDAGARQTSVHSKGTKAAARTKQ